MQLSDYCSHRNIRKVNCAFVAKCRVFTIPWLPEVLRPILAYVIYNTAAQEPLGTRVGFNWRLRILKQCQWIVRTEIPGAKIWKMLPAGFWMIFHSFELKFSVLILDQVFTRNSHQTFIYSWIPIGRNFVKIHEQRKSWPRRSLNVWNKIVRVICIN
jgi:hypothetical protein